MILEFKSQLSTNPIFDIVSRVAVENGIPTYVVGGYVRDLLLNRISKDIDFVCVGDGISLAHKVAEALGGIQVVVFQNFGTAMIKNEGFELEFVGARKESYRDHSRKPEVQSGTLEDDQNRRDRKSTRLNSSHT